MVGKSKHPIGRRLRKLREQRGLSRRELAERVGLSERSIVRLERGDDVMLSTYLAVRDHFTPAGLPHELMDALLTLNPEQLSELATLLQEASR